MNAPRTYTPAMPTPLVPILSDLLIAPVMKDIQEMEGIAQVRCTLDCSKKKEWRTHNVLYIPLFLSQTLTSALRIRTTAIFKPFVPTQKDLLIVHAIKGFLEMAHLAQVTYCVHCNITTPTIFTIIFILEIPPPSSIAQGAEVASICLLL